MTADFEKGLAREGDDVMVKMYCTYIHSLPNGSEEGDFLVLDLKGTNFKIYHISEIHVVSVVLVLLECLQN